MNQSDLIADTCDEIKTLLLKKNHDYGNSFSIQYQKYGLLSGIIRLDDKLNRLSTLIQKDAKVNESIEDTIMDIAGYAILTLIELRKSKNNSGITYEKQDVARKMEAMKRLIDSLLEEKYEKS